jgi:hypothetical protein
MSQLTLCLLGSLRYVQNVSERTEYRADDQTHYGSLTDDFAYHPNIKRMHMQTHVDAEKMAVRPSLPFGNAQIPKLIDRSSSSTS